MSVHGGLCTNHAQIMHLSPVFCAKDAALLLRAFVREGSCMRVLAGNGLLVLAAMLTDIRHKKGLS